jgi:hypothetical protein
VAETDWGQLMRKIRGWVIPDEDARSILRQIEEHQLFRDRC